MRSEAYKPSKAVSLARKKVMDWINGLLFGQKSDVFATIFSLGPETQIVIKQSEHLRRKNFSIGQSKNWTVTFPKKTRSQSFLKCYFIGRLPLWLSNKVGPPHWTVQVASSTKIRFFAFLIKVSPSLNWLQRIIIIIDCLAIHCISITQAHDNMLFGFKFENHK